jgi:hypothetical protein
MVGAWSQFDNQKTLFDNIKRQRLVRNLLGKQAVNKKEEERTKQRFDSCNLILPRKTRNWKIRCRNLDVKR